MDAKAQLVEQLLDLLWRQWTTLGVAGMEGMGSMAIDLEALLVLTAQLSPRDPRLRDEALDWCTISHRLISKPRLKQLLKLAGPKANASFGPFASALQHLVGGRGPRPSGTFLGIFGLDQLQDPFLAPSRARRLLTNLRS